MWCVPEVDEEYLKRMEDVLDILAKPVDEREPVVALDERPVQLLDSARPGTPIAPGRRPDRTPRLRVRAPRDRKHLLHRRAQGRRALDPRHSEPQGAALRRRGEENRGRLPEGQDHPPRDGQPEHPLREVAHRRLRRTGRPQALAALHCAPHAQARELAQPRRDRGEPVVARMPRTGPRGDLRRVEPPYPRLELPRGQEPPPHQLAVHHRRCTALLWLQAGRYAWGEALVRRSALRTARRRGPARGAARTTWIGGCSSARARSSSGTRDEGLGCK